MKMNANWHYREHSWYDNVFVIIEHFLFIQFCLFTKIHRPHISDSGSCDISVSSVSLSVGVLVGVDNHGHPTLKATGCSLDIGHLDITFHGGQRYSLKMQVYSGLVLLIYNITFVIKEQIASVGNVYTINNL